MRNLRKTATLLWVAIMSLGTYGCPYDFDVAYGDGAEYRLTEKEACEGVAQLRENAGYTPFVSCYFMSTNGCGEDTFVYFDQDGLVYELCLEQPEDDTLEPDPQHQHAADAGVPQPDAAPEPDAEPEPQLNCQPGLAEALSGESLWDCEEWFDGDTFNPELLEDCSVELDYDLVIPEQMYDFFQMEEAQQSVQWLIIDIEGQDVGCYPTTQTMRPEGRM